MNVNDQLAEESYNPVKFYARFKDSIWAIDLA